MGEERLQSCSVTDSQEAAPGDRLATRSVRILQEAKRFYPLLGFISNVAPVIGGQYVRHVSTVTQGALIVGNPYGIPATRPCVPPRHPDTTVWPPLSVTGGQTDPSIPDAILWSGKLSIDFVRTAPSFTRFHPVLPTYGVNWEEARPSKIK